MRVFDFDNTIYDGESIMDAFLYFLKKDFKTIIRYAPKFIKDFVRYKFDKITVDEAMASYGAAFKEYCKKYDNIYSEFEIFLQKIKKNIHYTFAVINRIVKIKYSHYLHPKIFLMSRHHRRNHRHHGSLHHRRIHLHHGSHLS